MQTMRRDALLFGMDETFGKLDPDPRAGFFQVIGFLEADEQVTDLRHAAYMLATVKHECGNEWRPIEEYGKGVGHKYGVPDTNGKTFYGRGYVQLTWADNYQAMGQALGIDLYQHPEQALEPTVAYVIMSRGMRKGSFTGKRLSMYINDTGCDYENARRIINGTDCAERIAGYAAKIENILRGSVETKGA